MRQRILLSVICCLMGPIASLAPGTAHGQLSAGVQGIWGSDMRMGVGARVMFDLDRLVNGLETVGSFDYFSPGDDYGIDLTYWEFTIGLAYRFQPIRSVATPYVGLGLNSSRFEASTSALDTEVSGDEAHNYPCVTGGFIFTDNWAKPFVEGRITGGKQGQIAASAGVRF